MNRERVEELILQSLEHEMGGAKIYEAAIACAVNDDLKEEWEGYLDETKSHAEKLRRVCKAMSIEPERETPGRKIVRKLGQALVDAITSARAAGDPEAAEIVAAECVVLAETKDHLDWELLGKCGQQMNGASSAKQFRATAEEVEDQEDQHLYHTRGFCRELWIKSLGMKAMLPPPEERQKVKTAAGAARAEKAADRERAGASKSGRGAKASRTNGRSR